MQLTDLARELRTLGNEVAEGDMAHLERILTHQAALLNAIYANLAQTAMNCELMKSMETYLRLGLKVQAQTRATAEALALLKNPAPYIRQANNYAGVGKTESAPNELLEVTNGERLDPGTAAAASGGDPAMEALGAVNRLRTEAGKARTCRNAWKGGHRPLLRAMSKRLNQELRRAADQVAAICTRLGPS